MQNDVLFGVYYYQFCQSILESESQAPFFFQLMHFSVEMRSLMAEFHPCFNWY